MNKELQEKIMDTVEAILKSGGWQWNTEKEIREIASEILGIDLSERQNKKYLRRCIKEFLKLAAEHMDREEKRERSNGLEEVSSAKDSGSEETSLSGAVTSLSAFMETFSFGVTSRPMDVVTSIPFAVVDEITESSPVAEDGLQLGDEVVKFGNVEGGDNLMQRLAAEAQSNQGQAVSVEVMRQGAKVSLSVTPRIWQGRGLLGCHFRLV